MNVGLGKYEVMEVLTKAEYQGCFWPWLRG